MELDELKDIWKAYDRKLDKSLSLNKELFRQLKLDKAKSKLRSLITIKTIELIIQFVMIWILVAYIVASIGKWLFVITSFILLAFVILCTVLTMRQICIIAQIKFGYTDAIAPLQKKLEKLKILLIQYIKLSYLPLPLSPLFTVLSADIWFNYDFFANPNRDFWIWSIIAGILLIPFVLGLIYQLSQKDIKPFWVRNFLNASGWTQITAANAFLKEIENFEKED